jgi:hypothetical protein
MRYFLKLAINYYKQRIMSDSSNVSIDFRRQYIIERSCISVKVSPVLRIRIPADPHHFAGTGFATFLIDMNPDPTYYQK